jgi:hypothetical protein
MFMTRTVCRTSVLVVSLQSDQRITRYTDFEKATPRREPPPPDNEANARASASALPSSPVCDKVKKSIRKKQKKQPSAVVGGSSNSSSSSRSRSRSSSSRTNVDVDGMSDASIARQKNQ